MAEGSGSGRGGVPVRIIASLSLDAPMEAEQLNQIANSLAGLADRAQAMRRYL
jgi:hypothetical protein